MRLAGTLIFTFILSLQGVLAQESAAKELILIHGVILDAETETELPDVHISINRLSVGLSDIEGKFSLYVYRGDTILFSFVGYSDVNFVTDTLPGKNYVAGIFFKRDTLLIGEVIVYPRMGDLRSEFMNSSVQESPEILNAQNNLKVSTFQGLNSAAELGDPATNYELLRQRQTIMAYEKGGIPSDRMVGLNILSIIPASIYLLKNGLPEKPVPPKPHVSNSEIEKMKRSYRESLKKNNNE